MGINENKRKKDHTLVNRSMIRKTFDTKQIELLEFLFEKGFQFYSSRLIDNNPREPLENIFKRVF